MFGVAAQNAVGTGATAQVSATPEAATEEEKVKEVDKAIAPAVVAAVTRQQTKALNNRIGALISGINVGGGGAGGGNVGGGGSSFSMLGATFNKGNISGGIAQALKQHGGALANGENLDPSVARSGSFALNAGAGNGAGGGGNFGIWGGADYAKIKDDKGDDTLDGHNASFFGGLDTAIASNVVVGVMFFHNRLKTDFASRNARGAQINGEYRLQANGVNPYILWRGKNASAWGGFGVGKGERTQEQPQEDINRTDDVDMYSGVFGFRFALLRQDNGFALDAQTDLSRAHTDIAGTKFKSLNLRAMLEARRDIAVIGGGEFSPFVQAAMLRQKDDNESVEGWEAAGGARWNKGASWSGELRGRIARLSNGNQEVGGSGLLRHNVAGNKGLMLSLQPTYGDAGEFSGGNDILTQTTQSAESQARRPTAGGCGVRHNRRKRPLATLHWRNRRQQCGIPRRRLLAKRPATQLQHARRHRGKARKTKNRLALWLQRKLLTPAPCGGGLPCSCFWVIMGAFIFLIWRANYVGQFHRHFSRAFGCGRGTNNRRRGGGSHR